MLIRHVNQNDHPEWLRMRSALWPDCPLADHRAEMAEQLADEKSFRAFVADRGNGQLGGFLEAALRRYADGCHTSPVGYIEGWYVDADVRQQGVGGQLVKAAEQWALAQGCQEMASDCEIDNAASLKAHLAIGYAEVERLIHFRKSLRPSRASR
jgi:aminoglycoside 6'-N-acetyltransferase I